MAAAVHSGSTACPSPAIPGIRAGCAPARPPRGLRRLGLLLACGASLLAPALLLENGAARAIASAPPSQPRPDPVVQARQALADLRALEGGLRSRASSTEAAVTSSRFRRNQAQDQLNAASADVLLSAAAANRARQLAEQATQEAEVAREAAEQANARLEEARIEFNSLLAREAEQRQIAAELLAIYQRDNDESSRQALERANQALAATNRQIQPSSLNLTRKSEEYGQANNRYFSAENRAQFALVQAIAAGREADGQAGREAVARQRFGAASEELETATRDRDAAANELASIQQELAQARERLTHLERVEQRCGGRPGITALIASIAACLPETSSEERGHSFPNLLLDPVDFLFIDPIVAIGYDYIVNSGSVLIASVLLPVISGTSTYNLVGDSSGGLCQAFQTPLGTATPGVAFAFTTPVSCFGVRGIDASSALDPNDPLAFVTGLLGSGPGPVNISQIPLPFDTDSRGGPGNTTATPAPLPLLATPLAWGFSRRLRRRTSLGRSTGLGLRS